MPSLACSAWVTVGVARCQVRINQNLLAGTISGTLSGFEGILPASKAEVRAKDATLESEVANLQAKNAGLHTEVATLTADNTAEEAVINTVIAQVNKLTPVSLNPSHQFLLEDVILHGECLCLTYT